ncbi:GntR family transcriptional regulator [Streptomyces sp. NPDC086077]|uniref:GntR family transcriptional regulator n=1 Tax=Streptomyces sp. NPDC086077 TaxID=3154862 RepID=UPI00343FA6C2
MVRYRIDRHSGVTAYMQIVQQTKQAMRLGLLVPGDRLPTAREVVGMTAINPNTVHKAYRELEHEGLVESRRGAGTFVTRSLSRPETSGDSALRAGLLQWLRQARAAGVGRDDVTALFTDLVGGYDALPQEAPQPAPADPHATCQTEIEET